MSLILLQLGCGGPERPGAPVTDSAGSDSAVSGTTDSGTFSADGPVLGVYEVELADLPQTGPIITFELTVTDPQDDVLGGRLFVTLDGNGEEATWGVEIEETGGGHGALLYEGLLLFGITDVELDAEYAWTAAAQDVAGNLGPELSGVVVYNP